MKSKQLKLICSIGLILILLASLVFSACAKEEAPAPAAPAAPATETFEMLYTTSGPPGMLFCLATKAAFDRLEERTNGRLRVKEYTYSQSVVKAAEMLKAIGTGIVDAGYMSAGYWPGDLPLTNLTHLPFLAGGVCSAPLAKWELYNTWPAFRDEFHKNNVAPLWFAPGYPCTGVSRLELSSIDDLKGEVIRCYGTVGLIAERVGATPVALPFSEIYTSMERGVIEGVLGIGLSNLDEMKVYPFIKTFFDPGIGTYGGVGDQMNLDFYNRLPADIKKEIIEDTQPFYAEFLIEGFMEEEAANMLELEKQGIKVWVFNEQEAADFKARVDPPDMWEGELKRVEDMGLPARELVERYQAALDKVEKDPDFECLYVEAYRK